MRDIRVLSIFLVLGAVFTLFTTGAVADGDDQSDGIPRITVDELKSKMDNQDNIVILDVRNAEAYAESDTKIKGAIRMPLEEIEERYGEIPKNAEIIIYCS
jgi:3-mercaptopyruvate sulfurtransferase SseA